MKKILAVSEYIFKQSFRNKMLNVLIIFAVSAIAFSLAISELAQETEVKMIKDFGLFSIAIFAFLTLMLSVTIQMFEETELKTISLVLVKPIKKYEYLIGKYFGVIATVFVNILLMLITLMLIIKLRGITPWIREETTWDLHLIMSAFYSFLGTALVTSTAILLTVITTSVPTCVLYLFFIYVLGHLTIHLKNIAMQAGSEVFTFFVNIVYYIVPNLELFNLKDKIYSPEGIFSLKYFTLVAGYSAAYIVVTLIIASLIFNRKEY